jgi:hypothetical protein
MVRRLEKSEVMESIVSRCLSSAAFGRASDSVNDILTSFKASGGSVAHGVCSVAVSHRLGELFGVSSSIPDRSSVTEITPYIHLEALYTGKPDNVLLGAVFLPQTNSTTTDGHEATGWPARTRRATPYRYLQSPAGVHVQGCNTN